MELDESGFPQPTGRFETLAADTVILALGPGHRHRFPARGAGSGVRPRRHRRVSSSLMTGCPGVFAGGDMVPSERTVTVGVGHGKRAAREIDAWLRGVAAERRAQASAGGVRAVEPVVLRRRRSPPPARARAGAAVGGFDEVVGGLSSERGGVRGEAVPVVRQLLRVRRLPGRVPGGRGDQARAGAPLPVRLRPLHRLPGVLRAVPGALDRDGAGGGAGSAEAFVAPGSIVEAR